MAIYPDQELSPSLTIVKNICASSTMDTGGMNSAVSLPHHRLKLQGLWLLFEHPEKGLFFTLTQER
jgi:hypothetical protein